MPAHRTWSALGPVIAQSGMYTAASRNNPHHGSPQSGLELPSSFHTSWLPISFPSHSEAKSAHSCWFHLNVKSPIVLKAKEGFVKITSRWRTVALGSSTNKRASQMVRKVFQFLPNMFSSNFKFPVYFK